MNTKKKNLLKSTFRIYTQFKIPWALYALEVVLGYISTKVSILYLPYISQIKTGEIMNKQIVFGFIIFSLLNLLLEFLKEVPAFYAEHTVHHDVQVSLIKKLVHLPLNAFENNKNKFISYITEDVHHVSGLISAVIGFFTGTLVAVASTKSLTQLDSSLNYILVIVVIYVVISTIIGGQIGFTKEKIDRKADEEITSFYSEHLEYFRHIKQQHSISDELNRADKAIDAMYLNEIKIALLSLLENIVTGSIETILTIIVFVFALPAVRNGSLNISDVITYQGILLVSYNSLKPLALAYVTLRVYQGQLINISNVFDLDNEKTEEGNRIEVDDYSIRFENVNFSYEDKEDVKNLSLEIPTGKITCLVGPNGSGKSTVIKLIERFYLPTSGRILLGKTDIKDINLAYYRSLIGYVGQSPMLINASIKENVLFGSNKETSEEKIWEALELAGCKQFVLEKPEGLDFIIGDEGYKLSVGQRQQLAIARAILSNPKILILDEATSDLDEDSSLEIIETLDSLMKDRTTIVVSHDLKILNKADYCINFEKNRI